MKLILHIGTAKTGTTTLQNWFVANDDKLKAEGIWYSASLGRPSNRLATIYARDADQPDDAFAQAGINNPTDHAKFSARLELDFAAEVQAARNMGCHIFIISCEHFHSRITYLNWVRRLHNLLNGAFSDIEILCYIRPQAELLQSRVAMGARTFVFGERELVSLEKEPLYYNYYLLWQRWRSAFDRVTFVPFKRRKDVVVDFCARLEIDDTKFTKIARTNERFDYRTAALTFNISTSEEGKRFPNLVRNIFIDELPVEDPLQLPRSAAQRANDLYRDSNEALVNECKDLTIADLEADLADFPVQGNYQKATTRWDSAEYLGRVIARLNCELELERARTAFANAKAAIGIRNFEAARRYLNFSNAQMNKISKATSHVLKNDVDTLRAAVSEHQKRVDREIAR